MHLDFFAALSAASSLNTRNGGATPSQVSETTTVSKAVMVSKAVSVSQPINVSKAVNVSMAVNVSKAVIVSMAMNISKATSIGLEILVSPWRLVTIICASLLVLSLCLVVVLGAGLCRLKSKQ